MIGGVTLLAAVLGLAMALLLARHITRGVTALQMVLISLTNNDVRRLEDGLHALAAGDLTIAIRPVTTPVNQYGSEEIGHTAAAPNTLPARIQRATDGYERARAGLGELVARITAGADSVARTAARLGTTTAQSGATAQQIMVAVQGIANGAQDTSVNAQSASMAVSRLTQAVDGIARGAWDQAHEINAASATVTGMAAGVEQVAESADRQADTGYA
jgi:methyl-accepting chemotaxis protein